MKISLIIILVLVGFTAFAQRVIWEKSFELPNGGDAIGDEEISSIFKLRDSSYIAFGKTSSQMVVISRTNYQRNTVIIKFNNLGDTTFMRVIPDSINFPYFAQSLNKNHFWVAGSANYFAPRKLMVYKVDTNGTILFRTSITSPSMPKSVYSCFATKDGGLLVVGANEFTNNGNPYAHEQVLKFDSLGQIVFNYSYNSPSNYFTGNLIEATNRGTYIISGSDGPDIVIHEIDSTGLSIRRQVFFTHPNRNGWQEAKVVQHPAGFVATAREATSTGTNGYLGLSANNGRSLWAQFSSEIYFNVFANQDSSFWCGNGRVGENSYFIKTGHSGNVSERLLVYDASQNNRKLLKNALYLGDGSAILGGYAENSTSRGRAFYLTRLDNIGLRYDPTLPVRVDTLSAGQAAPPKFMSLFPNPASSQFFVNVASPTTLQVLNTIGQVLLTQKVSEGVNTISTATLPSGIYTVLAEGYKATSLVINK